MGAMSRGRAQLLRRPLFWVLVVAAAVVAMALLALPMRSVPDDALGAKEDLESAVAALEAGDDAGAQTALTAAREHADDVQGAVQGIGGDVWSRVPVVGAPVRDARHLGNALEELTEVVGTATRLRPALDGPEARLFGDQQVDLAVLADAVEGLRDSSDRLDRALAELDAVGDSAIGVGDRLALARDEARDRVAPVATSARRALPLIEVLPEILGAGEEQDYLVAVLNPAEQRFSGGAALSVAPVTVADGRLSVGQARDTSDESLYRAIRWPKVVGNPFHRGPMRLSTATFAPDWTVSGEELLRGWDRLTGSTTEGLIVVDVVALGNLLEITGPAEVPVYGRLDAGNFATKVVGDYDAHDQAERHALNLSLAPLFADKLLDAGQAFDKVTSLRDAARGRHFAMMMRDPGAQQAVREVGLSGELSSTEHDYLAVFNQNANESKADFWQRRSVRHDVQLRADGSAKVSMTVTVHNDSPPYNQVFADPRGGTSVTRWNGMTVGVFLPLGVESAEAVVAGRSLRPNVGDFFGRPFTRLRLTLPPGATREASLTYVVPRAATALGDTLAYSLDVTPHPMVHAQDVEVRVSAPEGYTVERTPAGWSSEGGTASFRDETLGESHSFAVRFTR